MEQAKVLLPLDESEFSRQVMQLVGKYVDTSQAEIVLLRVTDMPQSPETRPSPPAIHGSVLSYNDMKPRASGTYPIYVDELKASLEAELEHELYPDVKRLEAQGFSVKSKVRFGDPAQEIIAEADQYYTLIMMATHARRGLSRVFLGSVAQTVLHHAKIPVLMFRPEMLEDMKGQKAAAGA